jgi:ABC-type sugar transport system ATPase subunit
MNCFDCRYDPGRNLLDAGPFTQPVPARYATALNGRSEQELIFGIRPEDVGVTLTHSADLIPATVYVSEPMGKETLLTLQLGETLIKAIAAPQIAVGIGEEVGVRFTEDAVRLFDKQTEEAIAPITKPGS